MQIVFDFVIGKLDVDTFKKEGLKIFEMGEVHVDLVVDTLRYFAVVFAVGYLCPLFFKKIKI